MPIVYLKYITADSRSLPLSPYVTILSAGDVGNRGHQHIVTCLSIIIPGVARSRLGLP